MKINIYLLLISLSSAIAPAWADSSAERCNRLAIATYVDSDEQVAHARALIKSLRRFGASYQNSPVYVALDATKGLSSARMAMQNVTLVPFRMPSFAGRYPLAVKAYAAAAIEAAMPASVRTLAWFDPETLVLGSLQDLDLDASHDAAIRPVFLLNTIGQTPASAINDYWQPIYKATGLDSGSIPNVTSVVDDQVIRAYYSCIIFSFNPRLGLAGEWSRLMTIFLQDSSYQKSVSTTFLQKLFLHQAILSALITARVQPDRIRMLPMTCGYPLNLHERLPDGKKQKSMDGVSSVILDELWRRNADWQSLLPCDEPKRTGLGRLYDDYRSRKTNGF